MKDPAGDISAIVVLPGASKAAEINRAISNMHDIYAQSGVRGRVQLVGGVYGCSEAITLLSGVTLSGVGPETVLRSTVTGSADDATNALIKAEGVVSTATLNTTLSAVARRGATSLSVVSAGTIADGNYVLTSGVLSGQSVTLSEVSKVSGTSGGPSITLDHPLLQEHESGVSCVCVSPIEDAGVRDLKIEVQSGTLAVGILGRSCIDFRVSGITGGGVSRTLINLDNGTRQFKVSDIFHTGGSNGIVLIDSCMAGRVERILCDPRGDRIHASGIQRGLVWGRNRPVRVTVSDCHLEHAGVGLNWWGGEHCEIRDVTVSDMDAISTGAITRMLNANPAEGTGFGCATAFNFLCTTTPFTDHNYGLSVVNCKAHGITTNSNGYWAYFADAHDLYVEDLQLINETVSVPNSYGALLLSDVFGGAVNNLRVKGMNRAIVLNNLGFLGGTINGVRYDQPSFTGQSYGIAVECQYTATDSGLRIRDFRAANLTASTDLRFRFPASFAGDKSLVFEDCAVEPNWFGKGIVARNLSTTDTFLIGEVVEIYTDSSGARLFRQVTGGSNELAFIVHGGSAGTNDSDNTNSQGYSVVLPLRSMTRMDTVSCTSGAVNHGDLLVWDSSNPKQLKVDNTATDAKLIVARADSRRASGSAQIAAVAA